MDFFFQVIAIAIPVIYAITVHEVAHGLIAKGFGDIATNDIIKKNIRTIILPDKIIFLILKRTSIYLHSESKY